MLLILLSNYTTNKDGMTALNEICPQKKRQEIKLNGLMQ